MKKFFAMIMVVAMMAAFASVAFAADVTLPGEGLVANYTFDKAEDGLKVIGDASSIKYENGKAVFTGGAGLVSDVDMGKFEALSVVFTVEATADVTKTSWPFVIDGDDPASWDTHTMVGFNMNANDFRSYVAPAQNIWCNGCWAGYDGDAAAPFTKAGQTHTVVVTVGYQEKGMQHSKGEDKGEDTGLFHSLYVDGTMVESWCLHNGDDYNITLKDVIGEKAWLFIGMSAFVGGDATEYGEFSENIAVDNLAVYNRALTVDEAKAASAGAPTTYTAPTVNAAKISAPKFGTQSADKPGDDHAGKTGFATIALAVVAVSSGAYVVSKKRSK